MASLGSPEDVNYLVLRDGNAYGEFVSLCAIFSYIQISHSGAV